MKTALVTGGAGFIGSAIVRALKADPEVGRVIVLDDFSTGKRANLAELDGQVELCTIDIRDRDSLTPSFEGVDWVFHEAAVASVSRSIEAPLECHAINVTGTLNVLSAARDAGVQRVVLASSSAIYGNTNDLPTNEDAPAKPESPYGIHKLTGELYARSFFASDGLETVSLRYFNVYGPRQAPDSQYSGVLAIFCKSVLGGTTPTIDGDGSQSRDFVFVDDVARANLLAAKSPEAPGQVFNIGRGEGSTVSDVWSTMQRLAATNLAATKGPRRSGDVSHSLADITRARAALGFEPRIDIESGLDTTLTWYRGH